MQRQPLSSPWREFVDSLTGFGLNVSGTAPGEAYEEILPGCRSVLVFASGGPDLWKAFEADIQREPRWLQEEEHPLDAWLHRALTRADPDPPPSRRWVRCAADETTLVDFRTLALRAGLGWHSKLGLLLHPEYGPWMGLRAACFTTEKLPDSVPLPGEGPCAPCPAPCQPACHGGAISEKGWDPKRCSSFHFESTLCESSCDARVACPVGQDAIYPPRAIHYHYNRAQGRAALGKALGIPNPGTGQGPLWSDWRET